MRQKKDTLIISFPTTTAAMRMEKCAMLHNIPGRLIPLPTEVSAGCGLAWKADPGEREVVLSMIRTEQIAFEAEQIIYC